MTFAPRPNHSKGQINRAGQALTETKPGSLAYDNALKIVNDWRRCHAYPLSTFNSTLRRKVRNHKGALVAQRLKRLPTIIDKLQRYPDMNLSQMQDIGGIRTVVENVSSVKLLQAEYKDQKRFTHKLKREHDYIITPKPDGYRGVHLVYEYNNTLGRNGLAASYKGLHVELQIRTELQHTWATAVEIAGTLVGASFKTGQGSKDWKEFFALVSSAFAIVEKSPVVERHRDMSPNEIYLEIRKLEKKLQAIDHLKGLPVAAQMIHENSKPGYYSIVVLDTINRQVGVYRFRENQLNEATELYANLEAKAAKGVDQVLVRVGDIKSLKAAYPNYFLDIRDFVDKLSVIIEEAQE